MFWVIGSHKYLCRHARFFCFHSAFDRFLSELNQTLYSLQVLAMWTTLTYSITESTHRFWTIMGLLPLHKVLTVPSLSACGVEHLWQCIQLVRFLSIMIPSYPFAYWKLKAIFSCYRTKDVNLKNLFRLSTFRKYELDNVTKRNEAIILNNGLCILLIRKLLY